MSDAEREKNILSELVRARKAIQKKYSFIKHESENLEIEVSDTLKPVITTLKKLLASSINSSQPSSHNFDLASIKKPFKAKKRKLSFIENDNIRSIYSKMYDSDDDDDFASLDNSMMNSTFKSMRAENDKLDALPLLNESHSKLDNIYGVRNFGDSYMLGDSEIVFNDKTVQVKNATYPKSDRHLELLFKK